MAWLSGVRRGIDAIERGMRAVLTELLSAGPCPGCGQRPGPLCSACAAEAAERVGSVEGNLASAGWMLGQDEDLIRVLKRERSFHVADSFAARLAPLVRRFGALDAMTFVPSSRFRLDFADEPAEVLARALGRRLSVPVRRLLRRRWGRRPQKTLDRASRQANARELFAARSRLSGRLLVVDDVSTTGSSLRAAADVLREAGAAEVFAAVAVRRPRMSDGVTPRVPPGGPSPKPMGGDPCGASS